MHQLQKGVECPRSYGYWGKEHQNYGLRSKFPERKVFPNNSRHPCSEPPIRPIREIFSPVLAASLQSSSRMFHVKRVFISGHPSKLCFWLLKCKWNNFMRLKAIFCLAKVLFKILKSNAVIPWFTVHFRKKEKYMVHQGDTVNRGIVDIDSNIRPVFRGSKEHSQLGESLINRGRSVTWRWASEWNNIDAGRLTSIWASA